jgi:hypothetical protein
MTGVMGRESQPLHPALGDATFRGGHGIVL